MSEEIPGVAPAAEPQQAGQTGQPEAQPQFVPFVVDGETYQLDARLAARLNQEPSTPPAQVPQPQQPQQHWQTQPPTQEPPLEDLMFRNPREFLRTFRDDIRREIISEYRNEQTQQNFWNSLYKTDEAMRQVPREFVNSIVVQNQRALQGLSDDQAMRRVADLVKERIAIVLGVGQNTQQPASYADGGSSPSPAPVATPAGPNPGEPQTLSQTLKARRMARQGLSGQS